MKELARWAPQFRVVNLNPTMEFRNEILNNQMKPGQFDVCVTTYDALKLVPQLKQYKWNYAIFDEAHKLKNAES